MAFEQRCRKVRYLRLDLRLVFLEALDHLGIDDGRKGIGRPAALQHGAHALGARFRAGALAANPRQFGRDIVELAHGEGGIVAGRQEIGLRAVFGNLLLGLAHLLAQVGDFRLQPARRLRVGVELGAALQGKVDLGHLVRDVGGKPRVLRAELDADDARLLHLVDDQLVVELLQHALFRRQLQRVLLEAEEDEEVGDRGGLGGRVEFLKLVELHVAGDLLDEVGGLQELDLAGDAQFVEGRAFAVLGAVLPCREGRLARLDEKARLALVFRRDQVRRHEGDARAGDRRHEDTHAPAPDRAEQTAKVDIDILLAPVNARHIPAPNTMISPQGKQRW